MEKISSPKKFTDFFYVLVCILFILLCAFKIKYSRVDGLVDLNFF